MEKRSDRQPIPAQVQTWSPPLPQNVKLNSDVSVMQVASIAAFGVVFWNSQGEVLLSAGKRVSQVDSVEHLEAQAILFSLQLAVDAYFTRVEIESDNLPVVNALKNLLTKFLSYL